MRSYRFAKKQIYLFFILATLYVLTDWQTNKCVCCFFCPKRLQRFLCYFCACSLKIGKDKSTSPNTRLHTRVRVMLHVCVVSSAAKTDIIAVPKIKCLVEHCNKIVSFGVGHTRVRGASTTQLETSVEKQN